MDEQLTRALARVLADLSATGAPVPRIEARDWPDDPGRAGAMLWSADGSGQGVAVSLGQPYDQQVAEVADTVQEWAIEALWASRPTNWPPCPRHPATHPLAATLRDGEAVWACPRDGVAVSAVGALG
ncbi:MULTISPECIES: hypothetical protein [unclassified Modestobacter]